MADKPLLDDDGKPVTLFGLPVVFSDKAPRFMDNVVLLPLSSYPYVTPIQITEEKGEDPDKPDWFCGCGGGDPKRFLRDLLNAFSDENSMGRPYVSLPGFYKLHEKYGSAAVELVLYLLDHMGYVEHSGSVSSSAWLTAKGEELREWANR